MQQILAVIYMSCPVWYDQWNIMFQGCQSFRFSVRNILRVPLCVHHPEKAMTFQQSIVHALQCPHDVDVHLLFVGTLIFT